jgi:hypothetical protein
MTTLSGSAQLFRAGITSAVAAQRHYGSTRQARRAGRKLAVIATAASNIETATSVQPSVGLTKSRVGDQPRRPECRGESDRHAEERQLRALAKTIRITSARSAPSAIRMPISWVRHVTE